MKKEITFENAYGCFYGFIKLQSFFAKMFLDDDATFVATRMEKHLLSLARGRYQQCNAYEKEAVRGLNWQEKLLFESYICDWYNERGKADALAVSNSELNNSTTWKVGRLIMYIPCKTKNKVKGLVKGKLRNIL